MQTIRCTIPLRIRLRGRPADLDLEGLAATVTDALAARIAFAERTIAAREIPSSVESRVDVKQVNWHSAHHDIGSGQYRVVSHQYPPRPASATVRTETPKSIGPIRKIEIVKHAQIMRVTVEGESPGVYFHIDKISLAAGDYTLRFSEIDQKLRVQQPSGAVLNNVVISYSAKDPALIEAFRKDVMAAKAPIPLKVSDGAAQQGTTGEGDPSGLPAEPRKPDVSVLADPVVALLFLDFLARYAQVTISRDRAKNGLKPDEVEAIIRGKDRARTVMEYFTQGWKEYRDQGLTDISAFSVLEETLLTQWDRSNYNVIYNRLEIRTGADGLGLYLVGTPFMYYDADGRPVPTSVGGYRDKAYRAEKPASFAVRINLDDRGLTAVLETIRHVTLDDNLIIYQAAKGYVDNRDLLWPAVRKDWDGMKDLDEEMKRLLPGLVAFLAAHLVAEILKKVPNEKAKATGAAISLLLKGVGKAFHITFAGELGLLALDCGRHLSYIERAPGQPLDTISQRHLESAAIAMRQLLIKAIAFGLTTAALKAMEQTAITIGNKMPPAGGGPAPALATAGSDGSGSGAAAATGSPRGVRLPIPPGNLQSSTKDPEGANRSAATNEARPVVTGDQNEAGDMRRDRLTRQERSARYFDYEGGTRGSFRSFAQQLAAHVRSLVRRGELSNAPIINESVLDTNTEAFIRSKPALLRQWDGWLVRIAAEMLNISKADPNYLQNKRYQDLEALNDELSDMGKGKVGDKRPDLSEVFIARRRVVVTDVTLKYGEEYHAFKTRFYVELLRDLLPGFDVYGIEYRNPTAQSVIE